MTSSPQRVVFDCNVYFQALISPNGPAGRCVDAALAGRVELYCSSYVIRELRETAGDPKLRAKHGLDDERVGLLIENIERAARFLDIVPERFVYPRDPDDAHYINLALAADATYVVSRDKDLLDLRDGRTPEGRDFRSRFPALQIVEPQELLRALPPEEVRPAGF